MFVRRLPESGLANARTEYAIADGCTAIMLSPELGPRLRLCVITVLYNSEKVLVPFLSSLLRQDFQDWNLVAIDNASRDETGRIFSQFGDGRLRLLSNAVNIGFSRAVNQGICCARDIGAEFVLLINNDTQFDPEFLSALMDVRDLLDARVLAPRIMTLSQPDIVWYAGGIFRDGWLFENVHEYAGRREPENSLSHRRVEFASGCCLLVRRDIFYQVGLFDESFFVYWEDADFCWRLKERGIPIYYSRTPFIFHQASALTGGPGSSIYIKLYYRSYFQFMRKYFKRLKVIRSLIRVLSPHYCRSNFGQFNFVTWGRIAAAAIAGLFSPLSEPPFL